MALSFTSQKSCYANDTVYQNLPLSTIFLTARTPIQISGLEHVSEMDRFVLPYDEDFEKDMTLDTAEMSTRAVISLKFYVSRLSIELLALAVSGR